LRDPNSRVVHYLWQAAVKRGRETPQGKLVSVNLNELHGRMGVSAQEVQEAVNKTAKARIIALVPEGVVVPDTGKMQKYLEFLEMKERFGD
jgi:Mn-dependent DtxR family transcriptional regulator